MLDDLLIGERQVVVALQVLAYLVDDQLGAVLRVVVKELQEPLRLLVDFFCAARGVLPRPQAGSTENSHFRN